jgi:pyruvate formate lyase activating enzyme
MEFLDELLDVLKSRDIHVTLDTSGYSPYEDLERVKDRIDLFLYDLKMINEIDHEEYTGVSNAIILQNLRELASDGQPVEIRIPLVCDVNEDESNIYETVRFLYDLKNIQNVNLLPYHRGGCEKYIRLRKGKRPKIFKPPSRDRIRQIKEAFLEAGLNARVGG